MSFTVTEGLGQLLQLNPVVGVHVQLTIGPFCVTGLNVSVVPVVVVISAPRLSVGLGPTVIFTKFVSVKQPNPS